MRDDAWVVGLALVGVCFRVCLFVLIEDRLDQYLSEEYGQYGVDRCGFTVRLSGNQFALSSAIEEKLVRSSFENI